MSCRYLGAQSTDVGKSDKFGNFQKLKNTNFIRLELIPLYYVVETIWEHTVCGFSMVGHHYWSIPYVFVS